MAAYGYQAQFGDSTALPSESFPITEQTLGLAALVGALRLLVRDSRPRSTAQPITQRQHLRKPVAVRASFRGGWGKSDCLVSDISEGGARVVCGHTPRVGERVTLECAGSTPDQTLRIACSVRHVSPLHTGLAFVAVSPEDRDQVAELIRAS